MLNHGFAGLNDIPLSGTPNQTEPLNQSDRTLLSITDVGLDSHIVIYTPGALDLACALLRQGVGEVTIMRVGDRQPRARVDVAIIPQVPSAHFLEHAIPCARRMLIPLSTLTIRIDQNLAGGILQHTRRQLASHGFSAIRSWTIDGDVVLRAELPLCGQLTCA